MQIKKIIARITTDTEVYIIFDSDQLANIERFKSNLELLEKHNISFFLLQQSKNLEDEIVTSTRCKRIQEFFNTKGTDQFKAQFNQCKNLQKKLADVDFYAEKLWTGALINQLNKWHKRQKSFTDLTLK